MKILIVQAQPDAASFSAAIETAFIKGAEAANCPSSEHLAQLAA